jgi:TolA-binding protein
MAPALPGREPVVATERQELARVDAELLDELLNNAGEVSIFRARVEQQMTSVEFNLAELERTVTRLREQLRKLELETEAMILHRHQDDAQGRTDFDPLELDRYSTIQQLSRALAESVSDVASIEGLLGNLTREGQKPAAAAGPHRQRTAERADEDPDGAVPAARAAPDAAGAPDLRSRPAKRSSSLSRAAPASSIARSSSGCCRRSSTCFGTLSSTASSLPRTG